MLVVAPTIYWPLPVRSRNGSVVRAATARILSERQFHAAPGVLQQIVNWLSRHLHLPSLNLPGFAGGGWQSYLVLLVLGALAVAVVIAAARRGLWQGLRSPRSPGVVVTERGGNMAPTAWLREAERMAAEGRYREAMRCRYRALVGELAQRGTIDEVPGRTSGDYQRLLSDLVPAAANPFSVATRLFERCWYGQEPSDASGQAAFDQAAGAVLAEVDARRRPARGDAPGRARQDGGRGGAQGDREDLVGAG